MMGQVTWDRRCLLLTNHALVMAVIAEDPKVRVKEIAERVEITERAVESLLRDLTDVGFISRRRVGRRNVYEVHEHMQLRHPLVEHCQVGELLAPLAPRATAPIPEPHFGDDAAPAHSAEHIVACTGDGDPAMVRSQLSSTTKGVMMKRTLVSAVIASLLVFVSAGAAATYGVHYAQSHDSAKCPAGVAAAGTTPDATPAGVQSGARHTVESPAKPKAVTRRVRPLVSVRSTGTTGTTSTTVRGPSGSGGVIQTPAGGTAGTDLHVGVGGTSVHVGVGGQGTTVDVDADPPAVGDILHLPDGLLDGVGL
jgi:DNA-binding transcriptional ArsR family regulator